MFTNELGHLAGVRRWFLWRPVVCDWHDLMRFNKAIRTQKTMMGKIDACPNTKTKNTFCRRSGTGGALLVLLPVFFGFSSEASAYRPIWWRHGCALLGH